MQITKSVQPAHGFTEPLGLLSDCHRRVEKFLGVIADVADEGAGGPLEEEQARALDTALRYFQQAASLHTQDEEVSLFPRLRATGAPEALSALAQIEGLEHDHRTVEPMHAAVDELGNRWLTEGWLSAAAARKLSATAHMLQASYAGHIRLEDEVIFPLAGRVLDHESLLAVGREMADRRGVPPEAPADFSRCGARRLARQHIAEAAREAAGIHADGSACEAAGPAAVSGQKCGERAE